MLDLAQTHLNLWAQSSAQSGSFGGDDEFGGKLSVETMTLKAALGVNSQEETYDGPDDFGGIGPGG